MRIYNCLIFIILYAFTFTNSVFNVQQQDQQTSVITFNIGSFSFVEEDGYHKIETESKGKLDDIGAPDLPTYSFNFSVDREKDYSLDYNVISYEIIENMNLYPAQDEQGANDFNKKGLVFIISFLL